MTGIHIPMGSVMAMMTVAHSLGMLCGALLGGLMMDFFQLSWAFALRAGVMIICTGLFLVGTLAPKQKMQEPGSKTGQ